MKRKIAIILLAAFLIVLPAIAVFAEETETKTLEAIEFLTGYGWGNLKGQQRYGLVPLIVDFDLNLKPLTQKINFNPPQLLQFQIEPFISPITEPRANIETGVNFAFKVGLLPQTSKFQPYLKMSAGLTYFSLHTKEQGTQFNFNEYGALGIHYFFRKDLGLTIEGRFRHLSNAGIDDPNSGINTNFLVAGITYQF